MCVCAYRSGRSIFEQKWLFVTLCLLYFAQDHIQEIFATYGKIKSVEMPMDRLHPHLSRCSAYVEFETPEEAQKALKYMDGGRPSTQMHTFVLDPEASHRQYVTLTVISSSWMIAEILFFSLVCYTVP